MELTQPSNETLTVEVAVKLPPGVKGKANDKKEIIATIIVLLTPSWSSTMQLTPVLTDHVSHAIIFRVGSRPHAGRSGNNEQSSH